MYGAGRASHRDKGFAERTAGDRDYCAGSLLELYGLERSRRFRDIVHDQLAIDAE